MTRYTVTWLKSAQDHLAQIWVDESDKQAITQAANAIDAELAVDPGSKGVDVREGLRSLEVPPLYVLFTVSEPDRLVEVASVRMIRTPPGPPADGYAAPTNG